MVFLPSAPPTSLLLLIQLDALSLFLKNTKIKTYKEEANNNNKLTITITITITKNMPKWNRGFNERYCGLVLIHIQFMSIYLRKSLKLVYVTNFFFSNWASCKK